MNTPPTVSRGVTWLLLVSAMLAGAGGFAVLRLRPVPPPPDAEFSALADEVEKLRSNTDAELASWRERRDGMQQAGWTQTAIDDFAAASGWTWNWTAADRASVQPPGPRFDAWPDYLRFVERVGAMPGVWVESIAVRASGSSHLRRLTEFRVGLRFIRTEATTGGDARSGPSPGPPPAASAEFPAPPRKVGPGPPLRRPGASAEPPAAGPDSAPSRPDPPGPRAGIPPTKESIKPNSP